ncbi:Holliday junction branch migration DNA helicase RuvB [bacterium]|nr:Holliday junction branch migration DNA helicase RuvB [bacterium]
MARERFLGAEPPDESDELKVVEETLRPTRLKDVIGQRAVIERLRISVDAAQKRNEPLQHLLLDGPPGLGKTTLASVIPKELGVDLVIASGPTLKAPKDALPYLTNLTERSVLFIDEIHRIPAQVEEFIYPAMEDFRVDIVIGQGLGARTVNMPLKRFTLIGATTRSGALTAPLRDRFVIREHLDYYADDELVRILAVNARKLNLPIGEEAMMELARRSRGTPRIANSHLYWIRNYAISRGDGTATLDMVREALAMQEVDGMGLDRQDRRYLETLIRVFSGGPAGVEALAATMNVPSDTLADEVEPYLLRRELIVRTPRGRQATPAGFEHIGALGKRPQGRLFGA